MATTYRLFIDWAANGSSDPADDVTARTLDQRTTVAVKYGRDQARQLSPTAPGELSFELDNTSRDYSPENAASPLAGYVASGRPVQLQATSGALSATLYSGYLDDFDIRPGLNDRSVPATCTDALGRLRGISVTTPLYQGIRTGDAVGFLLDAAGWPASARDLDPGVSYLPYWWLDGTDAFEALMQLADTDGPGSLITVDTQGRVVFRDRHHRLTRAASLTSQATWRSSGIEPIISDPLTYNHGWGEIVNSVTVEVPLRRIAPGDATQVWTSQGQVVIGAGVPVLIAAKSADAFIGAVVPVQGTDFTLVSGTVAATLSQTSGQSTIITLTSAGGAIVQDLALRAHAVQSTTMVVTVEDASSISRYGKRSYPDGRLPVWANRYDALAIAQLIVGKRAERLPTVSVTMRGAGNPLRLAECFNRSLSDRIHLTETLTGLNSDCFIEQISHAITHGGQEHVTTFGLEKVTDVVTNPFTFDVAGKGFDQGLFAGGGFDNPATMFRFDTAGHGFDQGVFAN